MSGLLKVPTVPSVPNSDHYLANLAWLIRDSTYPPSDLECQALQSELTGLAECLMLRVVVFHPHPLPVSMGHMLGQGSMYLKLESLVSIANYL